MPLNGYRDDVDILALEQAAKGDHMAFESVYEGYARYVSATIARIVYDPEDVRDLTQETFVKAYQQLISLKDRRAFPGWLKRIAVNQALAFTKRQQSRPQLAGDECIETHAEANNAQSSPTDNLSQKESAHAIKTAIQNLPSDFRETFVLAVMEKMPYKEVAEVLEISPGLVKIRVHRSRILLHKQLKHLMTQ